MALQASEMADRPLRHGSALPDWLVNSHKQIPAPSGTTASGYDRTCGDNSPSPESTSSFCCKAFTPLSVWVVESMKKEKEKNPLGCYCLRGRITDRRIISKTAFSRALTMRHRCCCGEDPGGDNNNIPSQSLCCSRAAF